MLTRIFNALSIIGILSLGVVSTLYLQPKGQAVYYLCAVFGAALLWWYVFDLPVVAKIKPKVAPKCFFNSKVTSVLGFFSFLAAIVLCFYSLHFFSREVNNPNLGWLLYLGSLFFVLVLASLHGNRPWKDMRQNKTELLAIALVLLVAAVFRFNKLTEIPYGYWADDAQSTVVALKIVEDPSYRPIFVSDQSQSPALIFYLYAAAIKTLGLEDSPILPVRFVTTLMSLFSLISIWLLTRELFGRWYGFWSVAILGAMKWHVNFSRFGTIAITPTLFAPLSLYFFIRAYKEKSFSDAVLAGLVLGLGMQFYFAMFIVPILMLIVALHILLANSKDFKKWFFLSLIILFSTLITYAPMIQFAKQNWPVFSERMNKVAATNTESKEQSKIEIITKTTLEHLRMFHFEGDRNGRHNYPGGPMLDPFTGFFFSVGFILALFRFYKPQYSLLLFWFFGALSTGILSLPFESPQAARTTGVTSVIAIFASLPLGLLCEKIFSVVTSRYLKLLIIMTCGCVFYEIVKINWVDFFNKQQTYPSTWASFSTPETKIGYLLRDEGEKSDIYAADIYDNLPAQKILGKGRRVSVFNGIDDLPLQDRDRSAVIVLDKDSNSTQTLETLKNLYPDANFESFAAPASTDFPTPNPILDIVRIPLDTIKNMRSWQLQITKDGVAIDQLSIFSTGLNWGEHSSIAPFKATIDGYFVAPSSTEYEWIFQDNNVDSFVIDDEVVTIDRGTKTIKTYLAKGNHVLKLVLKINTPVSDSKILIKFLDHNPSLIEPNMMISPKFDAGGLLTRYYRGLSEDRKFSHEEISQQVARYFHVYPLPRPYSIDWLGKIFIPKDGVYKFGTESRDLSEVIIDDLTIVYNNNAGQYLENSGFFSKGWHKILIKYQSENNFAKIYFYWTQPGGSNNKEIVPSRYLRPFRPSGMIKTEDLSPTAAHQN